MTTIFKYDAFSGMNFFKKKALIDFLCGVNNMQTAGEREKVTKAVEYALKDTTSFGGFIVCLEKKDKFVGAVVVNKSGMGGFLPDYLIVLDGVAPIDIETQEDIIMLLLNEADMFTRGNIAIVKRVEQSNEVHLLSLKDNHIKYLNAQTLRERVFKSIA